MHDVRQGVFHDRMEKIDDIISKVMGYSNITDYDRAQILMLKILKGVGVESMWSTDIHKLRAKLVDSRRPFVTTAVTVDEKWKHTQWSAD